MSTVLQDPIDELRVAVRQDDAVRCALRQVLKQLLHACSVWEAAQGLLQLWRSNAFSMQVRKHLWQDMKCAKVEIKQVSAQGMQDAMAAGNLNVLRSMHLLKQAEGVSGNSCTHITHTGLHVVCGVVVHALRGAREFAGKVTGRVQYSWSAYPAHVLCPVTCHIAVPERCSMMQQSGRNSVSNLQRTVLQCFPSTPGQKQSAVRCALLLQGEYIKKEIS
jgi:hypothetical protein